MTAQAINADPQELEKFGGLAHRWWDPQGEFAPLHEINPLRLAWIAGRSTLAGSRVLDVGCGGGRAALGLVPPAMRLVGVDHQASMLELFSEAASRVGVQSTTVLGDWPDVAASTPTCDEIGRAHV